jgi:hypothetical protein
MNPLISAASVIAAGLVRSPQTSSSTQKNPPQKDLWNPAFSISNYHMLSKIEVAMIKDKSA